MQIARVDSRRKIIVNDKLHFILEFTASDLRRLKRYIPLQIRAHPAGGL